MKLGSFNNLEVTTDTSELINGHISIIGASGSGKTYKSVDLQIQTAEAGATVLAIDNWGTLSPDRMAPCFQSRYNALLHDIDVHTKGIPADLFTRVKYPDGTIEDSEDTVGSIVEMISRSVRMGSIQKSVLRTAVNNVLCNNTYETHGFRAIEEELSKMETSPARAVREKLTPLFSHNIFHPGNNMIISGKINVIRLSKFSGETQRVIAEIVCAHLWRMALADKFMEEPIYLFIDECQNMPCGKDSVLAQMLSEGRRFGINLILATQFLENSSNSTVQQRITQCGLMLFFKPLANKIDQTARMIDPTHKSDWVNVLTGLRKGEFVAVGPLRVNGQKNDCPLKVNGRIADADKKYVVTSTGFIKYPEKTVNGVIE